MSRRAAITAKLARLDDEAWVSRASAGLVRRARKDLESAEPTMVSEGAALVVEFGGQQVRFDDGGADTARCDCPAVGVCRHIIAVGLWLGAQAEPAAAPVESEPATTEPEPQSAVPPTPSAEPIPAESPAPAEPTRAELKRAAEHAQMRADAAALLRDIVELGIAHVSAETAQRCAAATISAQVAEHYRLAAALRRIGDHLERIVARTAGAGESHVAADLASTLALIAALDAVPTGTAPPRDLIGVARTSYESVPLLRLVGLGAYPWQTASGYRGLTTMFFCCDDERFVSHAYTRPVATAPGFDPIAAYGSSPVWPGVASSRLATGALVDVARARRNPDGRLSGGDDTSARHEALSSAELFEALRPIRRWADLARAGQPVGLLEPGDELGDWVVLAPKTAREPRFDEVQQQVEWVLVDEASAELPVRLRYSELTANAVARLRKVAWEAEALVVGRLDRGEDGMRLMPLSVIRAHRSSADSPVDALFFDPPDPRRRSAPAQPQQQAAAVPPSPIEAHLDWLERVVERGVAPTRAAQVGADLRQRHADLREAGYRVLPAQVGDVAVAVLRSYAIAEQLRRLEQKRPA